MISRFRDYQLKHSREKVTPAVEPLAAPKEVKCVERDQCKNMGGVKVQDQRWISAVLFASLAHNALVQALS